MHDLQPILQQNYINYSKIYVFFYISQTKLHTIEENHEQLKV